MLAQYFLSIPPKNIKPEIFWCFQGILKGNIGLKWIKVSDAKTCHKLITYIDPHVPFPYPQSPNFPQPRGKKKMLGESFAREHD